MDPKRNAELAVIHLAKKQLRLDDFGYRQVVARVSSRFRRSPVQSAGQMTARERAALLEELHTLGFRRAQGSDQARPKPPPPGSFQEKKIRELWRLLEEAGALRDASEKALRAFIRRQTGGIEVPQWLTAEQANKVIEGLKAWHSRKLAGKTADDVEVRDGGGCGRGAE